MGVKETLIKVLGGELRANSNSPADPIWGGVFGSHTKSGETVTAETAMRTSAVYACVRVLSEAIASLPYQVFEREEDGKKLAETHALSELLQNPNDNMTSFEFRETMMAHLTLRGNFYAFKEMNGIGKTKNLVILNPARMRVFEEKGRILYEYTWENGQFQVFHKEKIWHVKGLSTDGLVGLSPIGMARESIGLALATEEYGARLFSNNAKPGGLLKTPGKLSEDAAKRLKKGWQAAQAGGANAHKVAILEEGLEWQSVGFSNDDSQFLETRGFQVEDIARIFKVPSILIGHADKAATFASVEQQNLNFVVHTIRPWAVRIEQSADKNLLPPKDQKKFFTEHNLDGLLRGDKKTRNESYALALQNRWMSVNEVRKKENMNSIGAQGDVYENPNISPGTPTTEEPTEEPEEEPTDE